MRRTMPIRRSFGSVQSRLRLWAAAAAVAEQARVSMSINILLLQPLIALIAGILILIMPRLLNYIVAIFLILFGLAGLWPHLLRLHGG